MVAPALLQVAVVVTVVVAWAWVSPKVQCAPPDFTKSVPSMQDAYFIVSNAKDTLAPPSRSIPGVAWAWDVTSDAVPPSLPRFAPVDMVPLRDLLGSGASAAPFLSNPLGWFMHQDPDKRATAGRVPAGLRRRPNLMLGLDAAITFTTGKTLDAAGLAAAVDEGRLSWNITFAVNVSAVRRASAATKPWGVNVPPLTTWEDVYTMEAPGLLHPERTSHVWNRALRRLLKRYDVDLDVPWPFSRQDEATTWALVRACVSTMVLELMGERQAERARPGYAFSPGRYRDESQGGGPGTSPGLVGCTYSWRPVQFNTALDVLVVELVEIRGGVAGGVTAPTVPGPLGRIAMKTWDTDVVFDKFLTWWHKRFGVQTPIAKPWDGFAYDVLHVFEDCTFSEGKKRGGGVRTVTPFTQRFSSATEAQRCFDTYSDEEYAPRGHLCVLNWWRYPTHGEDVGHFWKDYSWERFRCVDFDFGNMASPVVTSFVDAYGRLVAGIPAWGGAPSPAMPTNVSAVPVLQSIPYFPITLNQVRAMTTAAGVPRSYPNPNVRRNGGPPSASIWELEWGQWRTGIKGVIDSLEAARDALVDDLVDSVFSPHGFGVATTCTNPLGYLACGASGGAGLVTFLTPTCAAGTGALCVYGMPDSGPERWTAGRCTSDGAGAAAAPCTLTNPGFGGWNASVDARQELALAMQATAELRAGGSSLGDSVPPGFLPTVQPPPVVDPISGALTCGVGFGGPACQYRCGNLSVMTGTTLEASRWARTPCSALDSAGNRNTACYTVMNNTWDSPGVGQPADPRQGCHGHGTCFSDASPSTCVCDSGFGGPFCNRCALGTGTFPVCDTSCYVRVPWDEVPGTPGAAEVDVQMAEVLVWDPVLSQGAFNLTVACTGTLAWTQLLASNVVDPRLGNASFLMDTCGLQDAVTGPTAWLSRARQCLLPAHPSLNLSMPGVTRVPLGAVCPFENPAVQARTLASMHRAAGVTPQTFLGCPAVTTPLDVALRLKSVAWAQSRTPTPSPGSAAEAACNATLTWLQRTVATMGPADSGFMTGSFTSQGTTTGVEVRQGKWAPGGASTPACANPSATGLVLGRSGGSDACSVPGALPLHINVAAGAGLLPETAPRLPSENDPAWAAGTTPTASAQCAAFLCDPFAVRTWLNSTLGIPESAGINVVAMGLCTAERVKPRWLMPAGGLLCHPSGFFDTSPFGPHALLLPGLASGNSSAEPSTGWRVQALASSDAQTLSPPFTGAWIRRALVTFGKAGLRDLAIATLDTLSNLTTSMVEDGSSTSTAAALSSLFTAALRNTRSRDGRMVAGWLAMPQTTLNVSSLVAKWSPGNSSRGAALTDAACTLLTSFMFLDTSVPSSIAGVAFNVTRVWQADFGLVFGKSMRLSQSQLASHIAWAPVYTANPAVLALAGSCDGTDACLLPDQGVFACGIEVAFSTRRPVCEQAGPTPLGSANPLSRAHALAGITPATELGCPSVLQEGTDVAARLLAASWLGAVGGPGSDMGTLCNDTLFYSANPGDFDVSGLVLLTTGVPVTAVWDLAVAMALDGAALGVVASGTLPPDVEAAWRQAYVAALGPLPLGVDVVNATAAAFRAIGSLPFDAEGSKAPAASFWAFKRVQVPTGRPNLRVCGGARRAAVCGPADPNSAGGRACLAAGYLPCTGGAPPPVAPATYFCACSQATRCTCAPGSNLDPSTSCTTCMPGSFPVDAVVTRCIATSGCPNGTGGVCSGNGVCYVTGLRRNGTMLMAPFNLSTVSTVTVNVSGVRVACACNASWGGDSCSIAIPPAPGSERLVQPGFGTVDAGTVVPQRVLAPRCTASALFIPTTVTTQYIARCGTEALRSVAAGNECRRSAREVAMRPFYRAYNARGFSPQASALRSTLLTDEEACEAAGGTLASFWDVATGGPAATSLYARFWFDYLESLPFTATLTEEEVGWVNAGNPPGDWHPDPDVTNASFCIRLTNGTAALLTFIVPLQGVPLPGKFVASASQVDYTRPKRFTPIVRDSGHPCTYYGHPICKMNACVPGAVRVPFNETVFT